MSKQLWDYLRSKVQVVTSDGKVIKGFVTDFIDEMDNDEQLSSLTILALMNQLRFLSLRVKLSQLKQSSSAQNNLGAHLSNHYGKGFFMAILDDLQALYDNGWDASFDYNGQACGIFPNSVHDFVVVIGDKEYQVSSLNELISLKIGDNTLINIMDGIEVQYY